MRAAKKSSYPGKERRSDFRRKVTFPLNIVRVNQLTIQNKWDHEVGFNIGVGGMAIKSEKALPDKANVTVVFLLPNEDTELMQLDAKHLWTKRVAEGRQRKKLYYMGLEFTHLDPQSKNEIQQYLDAAW